MAVVKEKKTPRDYLQLLILGKQDFLRRVLKKSTTKGTTLGPEGTVGELSS